MFKLFKQRERGRGTGTGMLLGKFIWKKSFFRTFSEAGRGVGGLFLPLPMKLINDLPKRLIS